MDHQKMNDFLEKFIVGKFLVNFIPGLILFYTLTNFIDVRVGDGLIALVIVLSVSWTLGVLLELICFRKIFYEKGSGETFTRIRNIYLLLGKLGLSMAIGCVFCINPDWDDDNSKDLLNIFKLVFFTVGGILLYLLYLKQRRKG